MISKESKKIILMSALIGFLALFVIFLVQNQAGDVVVQNSDILRAETSGYVPLSGTDQGDVFEGAGAEEVNLPRLVNQLFIWGIAIAAILAVLYIIIGSIQYMTTDAVSGKEVGKTKIMSAVAGLILALVSWIILETINPNLLNTNILQVDVRETNGGDTLVPVRPVITTDGSGNIFSGQSAGDIVEGLLGNFYIPSDSTVEMFNLYTDGPSYQNDLNLINQPIDGTVTGDSYYYNYQPTDLYGNPTNTGDGLFLQGDYFSNYSN
jgi:hypothetical protein